MPASAATTPKGIPFHRLRPRVFGQLLLETARAWNAHHVPKMGAALAYYTAFSLAPLVVFILSVASLVVKTRDAGAYIVQEITGLMGARAGDAVQEILTHANSTRTLSWGTLISFLVLLLGASGAFGELQDSLNQIWEIPPQPHPFLAMIKDRILSFAMVFVLGFFMLVSLLLSAGLALAGHLLAHHFSAPGLEVLNTAVSFLVFTGLFTVIFRLLPDVTLLWKDVYGGALLSSALFIAGKFLLGWYIGSSSTFSSYGAAGSFVVILVWVFYSAQILFFGAEFSRVYTLQYGSLRGRTQPSPARARPS
jgi:membrane protein